MRGSCLRSLLLVYFVHETRSWLSGMCGRMAEKEKMEGMRYKES